MTRAKDLDIIRFFSEEPTWVSMGHPLLPSRCPISRVAGYGLLRHTWDKWRTCQIRSHSSRNSNRRRARSQWCEAWWATPRTENTACHWLPACCRRLGLRSAGRTRKTAWLSTSGHWRGGGEKSETRQSRARGVPYSYTQSPLLGHFGACERQNGCPADVRSKLQTCPFGGRSRN